MSNTLLTEPVLRDEFRRLWAEYTGWPDTDIQPRFYLDLVGDQISGRFKTAFYDLALGQGDLLMSLHDFSERLLRPMVHALASEAKVVHPLRDLAAKIEAMAKEHPGYSQAQPVIQNAVDHLSAVARCHECNARMVLGIR